MTTADETSLDRISEPSRVAEPDEGIGVDELQLAARNHGMPLEAMRYDRTPLGMHYLLTHYDIPFVDAETWRLRVGGLVDRSLELALDDIKRRPAVTMPVTMECAGNGRARFLPRPISQPWLNEAVGTMEWTGTPLAGVLDEAGIRTDAVDIVFTGLDHGVERGVEQDYARGMPVAEAMRDDVLLAYECNGVPIPPQHGFPLRLLVPGWYGMASVKWLTSVEAVDTRFEGYQQVAYALRQESGEPGQPLTWIEPRALVVPPGSPDFLSRRRFLRPGPVELVGRAWSGHAPISVVEVTTDDGGTWTEAHLQPTTVRWAWRGWSLTWDARPGSCIVSARATDESDRRQPDAAPWNRGGFANNLPQRVEVLVL